MSYYSNKEARDKVQKTVAEIILSTFQKEMYPPLVIALPSFGLVYPENSWLAKKQVVVLKKFTGKSEDWSTDAIFMDDKYMLNFLLESMLIFNDGPDRVPIEDWLVADRNSIILHQRIASYGLQFGVRMSCINCGTEIQKDSVQAQNQEIEKLDLSKLKQVEPFTNKFWYYSKDFKWNIYFKFLTIQDERELLENAPQDYREFEMMLPTAYMGKIVLSINNIENKEEIKNILYYQMSSPERDEFLEYVKLHTPYVKLITEDFKCLNCGTDNHLRADLDFGLLNGKEVKQIMLNEFYLLHKQLRIPFDDLYLMPVDIRKKMVALEVEQINKKPNNQPQPHG